MKLHHKVNHNWCPDNTDPAWAERVEREADSTSDAAERAWLKASERLVRATQRAEAEQSKRKPDRKKVKSLWAVVENRREVLRNLQSLAQASPAGSQHRGNGGYRGVATGEPL